MERSRSSSVANAACAIALALLLAACAPMPGQAPAAQEPAANAVFLPQLEDLAPADAATPSAIIDVEDGATIDLDARIVEKEIAGARLLMYGYGGQVPGPTLRVRQGSTITVRFTNRIDQDTTIHWHGLRHLIDDDGVPGISQDPIPPGGSHTYTLSFPDAGLYWYHPHIREDIQQDLGLAGTILVVPGDATYAPADREEVLVLDDILVEGGAALPYGDPHANFAMMGRYGNTMLVNGEEEYSLEAREGEVVRFFMVNAANARPFNLSFEGARMKLVGADMGPYERERFVESVVLGPGERATLDVLFDAPGQHALRNVNPVRTWTLGTVEAAPSPQAGMGAAAYGFAQLHAHEVFPGGHAALEEHLAATPDHTLRLVAQMPGMMGGMGMMGHGDAHDGIEWEDTMRMMNEMHHAGIIRWILRDEETGDENMDIRMHARPGELVKLRFVNDAHGMHPMQHPIHLHGQRFLVLSMDGVPTQDLAWKDTVLVPSGSTADILVEAQGEGEWMLHCHIAEHLESGMMASFVVGEAKVYKEHMK